MEVDLRQSTFKKEEQNKTKYPGLSLLKEHCLIVNGAELQNHERAQA